MDDRPESVPVRVDEPEIQESPWVVSVMGGAVRQGHWEPPEEMRVLALMGGAKLDFRKADLLEGVTEISVVAIMGGAEILVPPDVSVDARGLGIMGGFAAVVHRAEEADAPLLRIRGLALMGGVDVKIKPPR